MPVHGRLNAMTYQPAETDQELALEPAHFETSGDLQPPPVWNTQTLLSGGSMALVEHRGQTYRLQLTRMGRLILTK